MEMWKEGIINRVVSKLGQLRKEELGIQELIPGILYTRKAPVMAISIAPRVCEIARRELSLVLLVDGEVTVLAILGELGYVENLYRYLRFRYNLLDYAHEAFS